MAPKLDELNLDELNLDSELAASLSRIFADPECVSEELWRSVCRMLDGQNMAPDIYEHFWRICYSEALSGQPRLVPMWFPDSPETSNVGRWSAELGIAPDEFHRWTCEHRADFWSQATEKLGVRFRASATEVLDESNGVEQAKWFVGAQLNIAESCLAGDDDAVAIVSQRPGQPMAYQTVGELRRMANRVSNSLVAAGFGKGDGLAVVLPMTRLSIAIYLGVVQMGGTIVSIADSFAAPQIATRLEIAGAKAVFTYDFQERAGKQLSLYERVVESTEIPIITIPLDSELTVELRPQDKAWGDFLSDNDEFEAIACNVDDPINILFSSGTTGDPKAIPWTHLTPIKCGIDGYCHQDIGAGTVCAWPTNLGWMMGPWLIFATLLNRGTIALFEDAPMGAQFGSFVAEAKVNMLGVVPTIVKTWRKSRRMEKLDWSAIRVFSSTGESSQRDDMFYLSSLAGMRPVIEYCGGTEVGGGYATSLVTKPNVPAAFNSPAVGLGFLLLDEAGVESREGEVFLEGPSIGLSSRLLNRDHHETYFANTPAVDGHGLLRRHGDHFREWSLAGYPGRFFTAGGRVDDTMNLGGIKISSSEIERVLNQAEGVRETAAIGVNDQDGPSQLVVFVVMQAEAEREVMELRLDLNRRIKRNLNPLFKIAKIEIVDDLPRTASGKVMRRQLRAQYLKNG